MPRIPKWNIMQTRWTVLMDLKLHREVKGWNTRRRMELDALQRVIRDGGPDALEWDATRLANCASWEEIDRSYRGDIWLAFELDFFRVTLEVLPGRTVVIRPPD